MRQDSRRNVPENRLISGAGNGCPMIRLRAQAPLDPGQAGDRSRRGRGRFREKSAGLVKAFLRPRTSRWPRPGVALPGRIGVNEPDGEVGLRRDVWQVRVDDALYGQGGEVAFGQ